MLAHWAGSAAQLTMGNQYSLTRIFGIWALAAAPMWILSWIVFPALSPDVASDPLRAGVVRIALLTIGLMWLFVLSLILVRQEEGDLRWATIKRRLRLNAPRDPRSGDTRRRLWLWVIPFLAASVAWDIALRPHVNDATAAILPVLAEPPGYSFETIFESQGILDRLVGAWWFFGLFVVFAAFNTVLGEEFLCRGILLPRMEGVFGKWSWVANGVLFGFYHVHQPWSITESVIGGVLFLAYPSWRFGSTWMGVIIHSAQSVFLAFLVLGVVLGLA
jgi:membrane protease YdiL (CAAX protease family)